MTTGYLNPVGLILEKHSNREGEEVYSKVYREHPLFGKVLLDRRSVKVDDVLKKVWRWECTVAVESSAGVVDSTVFTTKTGIRLEELDQQAEQEMIALCELSGDDWVKISYKCKCLGR